MTPKQRLLAALSGRETDRVPWSPLLAYWWEAQPAGFQARGQLDFLEEIGADPLLRGFHWLFSKHYNNCEYTTAQDGKYSRITYKTPVGTLTCTHTYAERSNSWFLTEHPVKTGEDLKTLIYLYENMSIKPDYGKFVEDHAAIRERGLYVPIIGAEYKTSFQSLIEYWVGTEELVFMIEDYGELVDECVDLMQAKSLETAVISVDTPAEAFIFWEDSSTLNVSPAQFRKYTAPEIERWSALVKQVGKILIHHACGSLKHLLPDMVKTGIDSIDSISPPPTGDIGISDALDLLPGTIGIIGGIEPTVMLNTTPAELRGHVYDLIQTVTAKTKRFILANSDSCPPGVEIEKFRLISEIVRS